MRIVDQQAAITRVRELTEAKPTNECPLASLKRCSKLCPCVAKPFKNGPNTGMKRGDVEAFDVYGWTCHNPMLIKGR